ncbi:unnamed protein product [Cylindrotheca closterium]|uniref:DUF6824 domain-containing protein n=1 Tax=Cylindrotheca closterium TaxID=2856 RepID=A0AAD2G7G9_9STRA|nr:unnamed protein product [Cylindrotheca closterium]
MSILNQSFNQQDSCFGFCNDAPVTNDSRPFHHMLKQMPKEDALPAKVKQEKQEMDNLLSQALTKLTFEEREEHQEVIHGVKDTNIEDESLLYPALQELESHLTNTKSDSVYEIAERMDPAYVRARPFRVMFLRATEYDAKAAADRMLRFFELKDQLFGIDKLVKDITIADLDEEDIDYLKQSFTQLAGKDRSGRQVTVHFGSLLGVLDSNKTLQNVLRAQYFVFMKALQSEETQIRGIVSIWYAIGNLHAKSPKGYYEHFMAGRALPQKRAAIHVCVDDMKQSAFCSIVVKVMPAHMRARVRTHYGSLTECKYQLSTYGILPESLPLDANGNINPDQQLRWVNSCMMEEQLSNAGQSLPKAFEPITMPNQNDVFFTGGQVTNHLGNQRFQALIFDCSQAYDSGTDEMKRQIIGDIIVRTHEVGGRFLKPQGKGANKIWEEVPTENLRKKIMQAFRNRRRRLDAFKNKATLIVGEPLPPDVVFGRAQRNPGNDLLLRLIKDQSQVYESLNRGVKIRLVEGIMKTIKDQGGRFLEPAPVKGRWVEVSVDNAKERISTYFRNHRRSSKK